MTKPWAISCLGLLLAVLGCHRAHERDMSAPLDPAAVDASVERDAGSPDVEAVETCAQALESPLGSVCVDFARDCSRPIVGVPCCRVGVICEEGRTAALASTCEDDCAQSCELVLEELGCAAMSCTWEDGACGRPGVDDLGHR